jgi:hypothetical protein
MIKIVNNKELFEKMRSFERKYGLSCVASLVQNDIEIPAKDLNSAIQEVTNAVQSHHKSMIKEYKELLQELKQHIHKNNH